MFTTHTYIHCSRQANKLRSKLSITICGFGFLGWHTRLVGIFSFYQVFLFGYPYENSEKLSVGRRMLSNVARHHFRVSNAWKESVELFAPAWESGCSAMVVMVMVMSLMRERRSRAIADKCTIWSPRIKIVELKIYLNSKGSMYFSYNKLDLFYSKSSSYFLLCLKLIFYGML